MRDRLLDVWIGARETILDTFLLTPADEVLNATSTRIPAEPADDVVGTLTYTLERMKNGSYRVDYAHLRNSDAYTDYRHTLVPQLRTLDLTTLCSREARLAFWLNLYNALIIDAVIAYGVQRSVTEGPFGVVRFFRRAAYDVGGYHFSANDIEHGILRGNRGFLSFLGPQFGPSDPRRTFVIEPIDVRVHFALNCASRSCPPLRVYHSDRVHEQLDRATRHFIDADVEVQPARGEVHLSSIFGWFTEDFGGREGIVEFVRRYLPERDERRDWLAANDEVRLIYKPYDWRLNA